MQDGRCVKGIQNYSSSKKMFLWFSSSACTALRCACMSVNSRWISKGRMIVGAKTTARLSGVIYGLSVKFEYSKLIVLTKLSLACWMMRDKWKIKNWSVS